MELHDEDRVKEAESLVLSCYKAVERMFGVSTIETALALAQIAASLDVKRVEVSFNEDEDICFALSEIKDEIHKIVVEIFEK